MTDTMERREAIETIRRAALAVDEARERGYAIQPLLVHLGHLTEKHLDALTTSPRVDEGRAQIERECADLIARYYRREIGELMHQAEHWAENGKPLATHHRLHMADSYFQIVSLMERDPAKGWKLPFDEIRDRLSESPINQPGSYPLSAVLHRFRDPRHVAALATTPADPRVDAGCILACVNMLPHDCPRQ